MDRQKPKIVIIDDEPQIRRLLSMALEANGFQVEESGNAKDGMLMVSMRQPDLILLDLGLPDSVGLEVINKIRSWSNIPIIVLTVENDDETKILALDSGADDYITKPFNTGELIARIKVALRHSLKLDVSTVFQSGELKVNILERIVFFKDEEIKLTVTEYAILALLVKYAGRVLTNNQIIREIWGIHYADNFQTLRVHIAQIRKKIEENPSIPKLLITESGVGYRLKIIK